MRTEGGKVASSRTMPSSNSVPLQAYVEREDPCVKAMWDEEFFGHELPPNYKISRVRTPDGSEKKKESGGRLEMKVQRAIWDEEFLGHRLPANYIISRLRTPEGLEKKKVSDCRRESSDTTAREQASRDHRHTRYISEDTFEYNFDKTVDSYVLSEEVSGTCKDMGRHDEVSIVRKEECAVAETFEDRALRFGVEDWNLVGKKLSQFESKGSRRSARRGIFHSPSGSDTSSLISTLESSSFSCGSEGSSFAKTDYSSPSFNLAHVHHLSGGTIPGSAVGQQRTGITGQPTTDEGQFVELTITKRDNLEVSEDHGRNGELNDGNYLEFNFLDGKMIEREDLDVVDDVDDRKGGKGYHKSSTRTTDEDTSSEDFGSITPTLYESATAQSPGSENFFDTSHDSDWSCTHKSDQAVGSARNAVPLDFDEAERSNLSEERTAEDWTGETRFYNAASSSAVVKAPLSSDSTVHIPISPGVGEKVANAVKYRLESDRAPGGTKACSEERASRSPKGIQGASRKTRTLGSVLSQHLGFTAVPPLRYRTRPPFIVDQRESPAKVTAACIEWLWPEKGSMKPVRALRALAEKENAERERIGVRASPPVRNLDYAFKETRRSGRGRSPQTPRCRPGPDIPKAIESPLKSQKDIAKESRDSILASWAAVSSVGVSEGRANRSSTASKGAPIASSLKQGGPRGGVSPRKRSVSFGGHTGSKSGTTPTKSGPKNLPLELEVLCRPFGPVLKGVRFLPSAKRSLGRPPLFPSLGPQLASSSSATTSPPILQCGRLQAVLTRDGLPSYSLIMDVSEEIFVAKTLRVDAGFHDGISHLYTFHSYKGKVKGKPGWRQWGKKEKPCSDFAGNMTVTSTICPVAGSDGMQNFVESEFVLFDAKVKEISISGPTSTSPYPRSSFSSWDTVTPQRSPQDRSSTYSSPSSTYFSLPSPAPAGAFCTPPNGSGTTSLTAPSRNVSLSLPTGVKLRGSTSLDKGLSRFKQLEKYMSLGSPLDTHLKMAGRHESVSDSEMLDDYESRTWSLPQSQNELGAVVVRTPLERAEGRTTPVGDKWGWGVNFLRKSLDNSRNGSSPDGSVPVGDSPSSKVMPCEKLLCEESNGRTEDSNAMEQRCSVCGSPVDELSPGALTITLILPTGEHGCSSNGTDGPQPLIERWRSGGKCDCGSWDLGCGLTIISNQRVDDINTSTGKAQPRDSTLQLYMQGKKQQTVGLTLTPLREGCYTLGFQAPISPLHAFATVVAVLHSRDPMISSKKGVELKKRVTRIPVKVASSKPFSRQTEEPSGLKSLASYNKLVCPDPPSSPFGRA